DRFQNGVAIGSVNADAEVSDERDAIAGILQSKVGNRCFAFYVDRIESSLEFAGGMKYSGDAVKHAEIRVLEVVGPGKRCIARLRGCPRAEGAFALDLSRRL